MALARPVDSDTLRQVGEWTRPVSLAGEQLLAVPAPLASLFPEGGLRRGSTVTVEGGPGTTSLALALAAAASAEGSWAAVVNLPSLSLASAAELGVALERMVVVAGAARDAWATVVAALLDAVDVVWAGVPRRLRATDARRLAARARERGSVLVPLAPWSPLAPGGARPGDGWPVPADIRLRTVLSPGWAGPATGGAGRVQARRVEVVATGRGASARERRVSLWLPDADGGLAPAGARPAPAGPAPATPIPAIPATPIFVTSPTQQVAYVTKNEEGGGG